MTQMNNNQKVFLNDKIAKKIFKNPKLGKEFSARIISDVTGIPYDEVLSNIKPSTDEIAFSSLTVDSTVDAVYYDDYVYYDIEINTKKSNSKENQLISYTYQLSLGQLHSYHEYNNMKKVIQINIDSYDFFDKNEFMYKVFLMEEKYHIKASNKLEIIRLNLDFLRKKDYNEVEKEKNKLMNDLYFLISGDNLDNIYERSDELMKKIIKEAKEIAGLDKMNLFLTEEELYEQDKEYYTNEGFKMGLEQKNIEIAKNLLKENIDIKIISKATGLSFEELNDLKEEK